MFDSVDASVMYSHTPDAKETKLMDARDKASAAWDAAIAANGPGSPLNIQARMKAWKAEERLDAYRDQLDAH
jgi:hypothetical protein